MLKPLTTLRDRLHELCVGLKPEQSQLKPSTGDWCVAEIVEHLALAERTSMPGIKRSLSQPEAAAETMQQTSEKSAWIQERIAARLKKVSSPGFLLPNGRYALWPGPLEVFQEVRGKTLALAATADAAFDSRVMSHPIFGPLTQSQWFDFTSAHCKRHTAQIEEILAAKR